MLCAGYLGAFRDEATVRISFGGLRKYWKEGITYPTAPYISMILGCFKREREE